MVLPNEKEEGQMKTMLCPYKVKINHIAESLTRAGVDQPEFCECDYDECYFYTTKSAFDGGRKISVPECKRVIHDCEVNT